MSLSDILSYIGGASSKDLFVILADLNQAVSDWANAHEIKAIILFALGLAASVIVGLFGYKLIKAVTGLGLAYVGYFAGAELYALLSEKLEWLPEWSCYVIGGVLAIVFFCLAFVKFSYAIFTAAGIAGYLVVLFYFENQVLAVGGGVIAAMLSILMIRAVYILATGFACGMLSVSFLSAMLPKVDQLRLEDGNWIALFLALGLTALFAVVQFVMNRHPEELEA